MKKRFINLLLVIIAATLFNNCGKEATAPDTQDKVGGNVTLKGQVIDVTSGNPLAYALIKVFNDADELTLTADSTGYYKTMITIDKAKEIKIVTTKEGYRSDTTNVFVSAGNTYDMGLSKLAMHSFATLKGIVVDKITGNFLSGAVIRIVTVSIGTELQIITDIDGKYNLNVPMDNSKQLYVITIKEGYYADTTSIYASAGRTIDIPAIKLRVRNSTNVHSGSPASIYLVSQSSQSIGVKESGSVESLTLVWEVQDSIGTPVDVDHSAVVNFKIGITPGGGEYISPASAATNSLGRVSLTVSSGTKAGVMQFIAEITTASKVIRSKPVSVAIHGGLPDQSHFSISPKSLNIPGYIYNGIIDPITAYVGDKYGNPVRPKTAVYFTTDGGYIEGSALTDEMGLGTAKLISADPRPVHPTLGRGFATITATTADESYNSVKAQTIVLFSGLPYLSIAPSTIDIPHLGSQVFTYNLKDQNNNPLSAGTTISVRVDGGKFKVIGDANILLPDTQSRDWTQFSFTVINQDSTNSIRPIYIDVSTTGPNGSGKISISGVAR